MQHFSAKALILTTLLTLALGVGGVWADSPTDAVKGVIDQVVNILNDPALKAQKDRRRQMVKQTIDRRFDYEEMDKRSLEANWKGLSAGQRQEFVKVFSELLEASYADKIMKYAGEKVRYTGERKDADFAEVQTQLLRKNDKIPMNYRLIEKSGNWMVYDVVIEGVSLVSNYRSQFGQVIRQNSFAELLKRMKTKISELKETERG